MKLALKRALIVLAVGLVSACAGTPPMPLTDVQYMKAKDPQYGRDIYGARRAAGESVPTVAGNQIVQIRTYSPITDSEGSTKNVEFGDAQCVVDGDGTQVSVRSPGAVHVALYGFQTPQMTVKCEKEGFDNGIAIIPTFNMTQQENLQIGASAGGLIGLAIMAGVNAASDETNDKYMYGLSPVVMKPSGDRKLAYIETQPASATLGQTVKLAGGPSLVAGKPTATATVKPPEIVASSAVASAADTTPATPAAAAKEECSMYTVGESHRAFKLLNCLKRQK